MMHSDGIARTHHASGRFLFLLLVLALGCGAPQPGGEASPAGALPEPVLEPGRISRGAISQAARLFRQAEEAFEAERYAEAGALARQVTEGYGAAPVSGRALFLQARAALGEGHFDEADGAARRYGGLLAAGDPRLAQALLLQADAQAGKGDQGERLARLLQMGSSAPVNARIRGAEQAREAAASLDLSSMAALVGRRAPEGPLAPIALARYARLLFEAGREDEASRYAALALSGGAQGADSLLAEAVLTGDLPGRRREPRRVRIATVLPVSGSPAMRDFAALVAEGVEVAAASVLGDDAIVEIEALDDEGDAAVAASLVRSLAGQRLAGAVGFLEGRTLGAATEGRRDRLPLVSPTARAVPEDGEGVFTLAGADPQAAASVARYGARTGILRAAVIHSRAPESVTEANAIEASLRAEGVEVVGRFVYDVGATFFSEQIKGAQEALRGEEIRALNLGEEDTLHVELLDPVALFLPIPPEDVEFVAPQVTHFGLDTLGIAVLGTSGWTDSQALEAVDTRHTDGVVATAPIDAGPGSAGYARFRAAYEDHFQRSLVSSVPALGYDAALLLLEGVRSGGSSQAALRSAIGRIRALEGATGIFSVVGGQVVRRTQLVRLDHGVMIPIG